MHQKNIQPELTAKADLKKDAQGRQKNSQNDADEVHCSAPVMKHAPRGRREDATSALLGLITPWRGCLFPYSRTVRRRRALPITETELRLMAAAAIIGLSRSPNTGYSTPAATGTPSVL